MTAQFGLFEPAPMGTGLRRSAVLSPDGLYRYRLTRTWDDDLCPTAFVMLNPSTADAEVDDPTVRRCMSFARSWGAGGIEVANLVAMRATDPSDVVEARARGVDVVGPENEAHLRDVFARVDVVVCAWGAHPMAAERAHAVLAMIPDGVEVTCLGTTKDGSPKHPLYLPAKTPRRPFEMGKR